MKHNTQRTFSEKTLDLYFGDGDEHVKNVTI